MNVATIYKSNYFVVLCHPQPFRNRDSLARVAKT